jgi:hypothetical protein
VTILCRDSSTVDSRQWSRDDRKTENAFLLKTQILCWGGPRVFHSTNVISRIFVRRGDTSAACRHVCYPVLDLANFRQSVCRKRQTLVGNNKALSEATNACRKRQSLVGTFILSCEKPP